MKSIGKVKLGLNDSFEVLIESDIVMNGKEDYDDLYFVMFNVMNTPLRLSIITVGNLIELAKENTGLDENKLMDMAKNDPENYDVICLTDVRYNFYENDECAWVKQKGGIIVYISRFLSDKDCFLEPKNPEEKAHDPLVKNCADYEIIVEEKQSKEAVENETLYAVQGLLKWMEENGKWKI